MWLTATNNNQLKCGVEASGLVVFLVLQRVVWSQMNLALIHDRLHIKTFWEKRINDHGQHAESEEMRMNSSALKKLVPPHDKQLHSST